MINRNFDFSGILKFWKIYDLLKADLEPEYWQWNTLFNTPGYSILCEKEYSKKFFIDNYKLAFMPSKKLTLTKLLSNKKTDFIINHINHFSEIGNNRESLNKMIVNLNNKKMHQKALELAKAFLPNIIIKEYPPVSFVFFCNDARATNRIVFDLLATIKSDFIPFLAHEYHHYYSMNISNYRSDNISNNCRELYEIINQIHLEGIADQIDKNCSNNISYINMKTFFDYVKDSPSLINKINNISANEDINITTFCKALDDLIPLSGHSIGFYMANKIIRAFGRNTLIQTIGNPVYFYKLFNSITTDILSEYAHYSKKFMNIICSIEKI